jgi:hypothetical protein
MLMTNLPTAIFYETEMVNIICGWIEILQNMMRSEPTRQYLEATLCEHLQRGLVEILQAVAWADGGCPIADAALRRVFAEKLERNEEPSATLKAYGIKASMRGPVTRGRGHYWFDDWRRNIGIALLVRAASLKFNLPMTRNREQRRRQQPSAPSIAAIALGRYKFNLCEKTVENIATGPLQEEVLASPLLPLLSLL